VTRDPDASSSTLTSFTRRSGDTRSIASAPPTTPLAEDFAFCGSAGSTKQALPASQIFASAGWDALSASGLPRCIAFGLAG
jgi:hypothetical protein